MEAYATALDGMTSQYPTPAPQAPPSMLSWIPGTIVGDVDMRTLIGAGCFGEMELTNTGKNSILIRSINMQLTAKPVRTSPSFQYRMINLCALLTGDERNSCPPQAAGSGPLFEFFRLKAAPSGTVFTPKQEINDSEYQSGSDIVLHPNDPYALPVLFYFMSLDNLVYSLTPELLLDTPNGAQQAVALPQLATTLYFANPSQFSCYTLQGDTFVKGSMDRYSSTAYCV